MVVLSIYVACLCATTQPFLMLDHFGPATYGPGEAVGAPDHPHRGQETVTYMVKGTFEHKDSYGNSGTLKDGETQNELIAGDV
jgi:redox-sensitive bicupin YhaK (pirin superfamily)